ncbi:MAG: hypothetical protein WCI12_10315 [Actinomycetes bacterium]|jgi:hypothetical protein
MSTETPERIITDHRGTRYGEVLAAYVTDDGVQAHVYGTQLINDCPQELWEKLDPAAIKEEMGAIMIKLNGPRYWMLDGLGSKAEPIEPVMKEFGGIMMRRIAVLDLGSEPGAAPYFARHVDRGAVFFFDAGKRIFELLNPEGEPFIMQARCVGVDPMMTEDALLTLGERLALPEDWTFRTRILEEELVIDTSDHLATVLQDEFENTYTLPY